MSQRKKGSADDRLTVSLAPGQREMLEEIAKQNDTTLAYVVRYALKKFAEEHHLKNPLLDLPSR